MTTPYASAQQAAPAVDAGTGAALADEQRIMSLLVRRLIPFLALIYVVAYIDRSVVGFAKLHMNAAVGISDASYGLGAGLFFIGYFLCEVPSNLALERFGARVWFARILFTWGVITMLMSLVSGPASFYVLRFLLGAAEAGLYPGILYFLTKWFPMRHRARIIGLLVLAQPLAGILTGPVAGFVLSTHGVFGLSNWQTLFVLSGLPAVLLCVPTLRVLPESPANAKWLAASDRAWIERELAADSASYGLQSHGNPLAALKDKRVLLLALLFLPFPLSIYGLSLWLPTIIKAFGVTDAVTGLLSAVPYLFAVVGLCVVPRHSDRKRERYWHIVVVSGAAAITMALSAWTHTPALQFLFICLTAFSLYSIQAVVWALPGQFLSGARAAVGIATINSLANLGGYVGPYGIGLIKDATGSLASGLYFLSATLLFAVVITFVVRASLPEPKAHAR
ncbi:MULTISPECIES: MFS transporter [Paraburkholderia]|jgi:MFS family permease|uniref:MFS transporter n=1 Tax=Paraburkholderia hospita TaxID=169430 RepID=A0AAN1JIX4_9BURK|nr:MFS transporter [Paraburkholderia hospita]SOE83436.1 Sugar phosphate permease [Burkholderia sp. YR290]AUT73757.1 MFS transporter [Paraburkholderia hospita]EIM96334.1 major facilitator transporter [Paraburkholderia hospita]OUL78123.1 MFS transporter [Paraburkholderia hospita]OUL79359.1 MFS transporter [Paraburkholderia hospita]